MRPAPPPFVELGLTPDERAQIEGQLAACFDLEPEAAHTWVETTARRGVCFGRVASDGAIAASFAAETLPLVRGDESRTAVMLQSCYVHPAYRGRGYGLARADVEDLRRRFAADAVALTLFDDGLVPYWRRRGFEVVQRAEVIGLSVYLERAVTAFSPALDAEAIAAKVAENVADGATVTELAGGRRRPAAGQLPRRRRGRGADRARPPRGGAAPAGAERRRPPQDRHGEPRRPQARLRDRPLIPRAGSGLTAYPHAVAGPPRHRPARDPDGRATPVA